ncbi:DUF397 domain-containing protein [Haloechinothrix sp. YIM 98757]|uniref:DUF397 domain-containing protein n=1 Tax=Haloechinothrix aidingensis TaxID=2752311 RepID=A0A838AG23_9PSEU|nr:DUF397 domain-containing protein [Haloechinothrix aidingensis]MBA0128306.1 DUF397 domain-containing protein [Haloechinothrix aidingensis]
MSTADLTGARWRTSSYSGNSGDCVEVAFAPRWRASSYSSNSGNCVEVARAGHLVGLRDSKSRAAGTLAVPAECWHAFLGTLTGGAPHA